MSVQEVIESMNSDKYNRDNFAFIVIGFGRSTKKFF